MRFPEFKGEWDKYRISDILEFFPTNSLSWDQLEYGTDNIYNLHYGLIHKGLPTQIEVYKCSLPNIKEDFIPKNYTLCENGDIAFADASEDTNDVGKVVEFLNCENNYIVCGLHTIHGRDKKNLTIKGFKGYAFSSKVFRQQIRRLAQGTKIYSISQKNFNDIFIGIPSKEEQIKIATLSRLLDKRITTQNKIIEDLKLLKSTIRHQIFSKLEKSNFETKQVNDILDYEQPTGYIVDSTDYCNDSSLTPVLTANKAFILGYSNEKNGIYDKGNCIIFDDFTMDIKYVDFPFKVKSSAIKILKPKHEINLKFIFEYLSFLNFKSNDHKRHYISEVESIQISIPEFGLQSHIASLFFAIDKKITIELSCQNLLFSQKQYLLNSLFV